MGAQDLRRRRLAFLRRRRRATAAMTVTEHLRELRSRLVVSLIGFFALSIAAFAAFDPIADFLLRPLCAVDAERLGPQGCNLITTGPVEPVQVRLKVAALVGIVLASPLWLYELWAFVVPGLNRKERRYALPFVLSSVSLFLLGAFVAYSMLPTGLNVLIALGGENIVPLPGAEQYFDFVGLMLLGFGVMFELPLVLFFLGLLGVVNVEQLRAHRRLAFVVIAALSAIVTPTQDPFTMLVLAVPLYLLYELVILLLARRARKRVSQSV